MDLCCFKTSLEHLRKFFNIVSGEDKNIPFHEREIFVKGDVFTSIVNACILQNVTAIRYFRNNLSVDTEQESQ